MKVAALPLLLLSLALAPLATRGHQLKHGRLRRRVLSD